MRSDAANQEQQERLLSFTARFLEQQGALIEKKESGISALLPGSLAEYLGTREYITLSTQSGEGDHPVHFGAPLLDRILTHTSSNPPLLNVSLNFPYLKSAGFDSLAADQFHWHKATGSVTSFGQIQTRYLILNCRYRAQSDEQKEGLFDLAANLITGAVIPGMTSDLSGIEKTFGTHGTIRFAEQDQTRLHHLVRIYGKAAVAREIDSFKSSMNRRYARDAKSLDEYYQALGEEMAASLAKPHISEALAAERKEKLALIPEELAAKKKDLLNKYRIRITVCLAAAMVVTTHAVKVLFTASVGRHRKTIPLIYNPVTKGLDPLVCETCHESTYMIAFGMENRLQCYHCHEKNR